MRSDGQLILSLDRGEVPAILGDDEIVVRVDAAPCNPTDLALAIPAVVTSTGTPTKDGSLQFSVRPAAMPSLQARVDKPQALGSEGAGLVVAAGQGARRLMGKNVAFVGTSWMQYRILKAKDAIELPAGVTAAEGAAVFVNPMTVLGMIETMREAGHNGIVHTAAASNLGQMLVKACAAERIPLVNIVRSQQQVDLLKAIGAVHVCDSTSATFREDLAREINAAGIPTCAFDATGGGKLAGMILSAMESNLVRREPYSRYGSSVKKTVFIYGRLDVSPTSLPAGLGFAWSVETFLLFHFLKRIGGERRNQLQQRVLREIKTTFASQYAQTITLQQLLEDPQVIARINEKRTGEKFLLIPSSGPGISSKL